VLLVGLALQETLALLVGLVLLVLLVGLVLLVLLVGLVIQGLQVQLDILQYIKPTGNFLLLLQLEKQLIELQNIYIILMGL
jgi:hypothetical protein